MTNLQPSRPTSVGSKIRRVTKISISEEVAQQIMDLISNGDLKPGERLPSERELCKNFGAGRSSIREALRCLSIVGVIDARVGNGTSVASDGGKFLGRILEWRLITEKHDIQNLLEVRCAVESLAASNAAIRATPEDIRGFQDLVTKMKASVNNEKQFAAHDLDFHLSLAKASGNTLLFDLITMIRGQLVKALSKVLLLPKAMPLSLKEHAAILEAIKQRAPAKASAAMHNHLTAALGRYNEATRQRILAEEASSKLPRAKTRKLRSPTSK